MKNLIFWGGVLLLPLFLFSQTIPFQDGWPVYVNGSMTSPIKIADIDNNGKKEVIYGDGSFLGQYDWWLYVKKQNGIDENGWPKNNVGCISNSSLADIDNDGYLEIIKTCGGLRIWKYDGTLLFHYPNPSGISLSELSMDDLDNDGIIEIIVTTAVGGAVFVFEPDGSVRDGWPYLDPYMYSFTSASIGDIDIDGLKEIIIASGKLYCFKPDGLQCNNFPIDFFSGSHSKPVLADLDGDGYLEIIFGWDDANTRIIRYDGTMLDGYPINHISTGISLSDINNDSQFELIYVGGPGWANAKLNVYNALTTEILPNFPISPIIDSDGIWYPSANSPNICELSNDFGKEITTGAGDGQLVGNGKLFAFNLNAEVLDNFPSDFLYHRILGTGCSVDDLDGDGDVEICCGSRNDESITPRHSNVFCWDSPHPWNRDMADWMMDGFDLQNTGRWRKLYHIDKINSHISFEGCIENPCFLPPDGNLYAVTITAKRQFSEEYPKGQDVRLSRTLGCGEYEGPIIDNGDGTYIRFFRGPTAECITKIEGWVNEFKLEENIQIVFSNCNSELGDVNSNGLINSMDAGEVLNEVVNPHFDLIQFCKGDVNRNGRITALDASFILQCTVGLCSNLPPDFLLSCTSHSNCP